MLVLYLAGVFVLTYVDYCTASWGDTSPEYRTCLNKCILRNCSHPSDVAVWQAGQSLPDYLVGWNCRDDCAYVCMWKSADVLGRRFKQIPQYHGRWPFARVLGLQEPASVLFSILNLVSHLYMLISFTSLVPSHAPMYRVWLVYSVVSMNAWIWSTVFHARDTPLTEMLDYFCAFSTVLFSLLAFFLRISLDYGDALLRGALVGGFVGLYCHHVYSMATVKFDYGYNMKVNVVVGGLNCLCWLVWFYRHRKSWHYVKHGVTAVLVLTFSVSLELLEFTPILWAVDSHALWHLVTSPLPLLWYRFAASDCLNLIERSASPLLKKTI